MALIAAYIHYKNKLDSASNGTNGTNEVNAWKEFGRKKAVSRF
jgi:hypothetical protein